MMLQQVLALTATALLGLMAKGEGVRLRGIPTFPSGLSDSVAGLGNSFQDNKPPPKDEQPLINKLKDTAEQVMEEEVAQELRTGEAKKAAYLLASQNVVKLVYTGGCPRTYSQSCPKGWAEASVRKIWIFTVDLSRMSVSVFAMVIRRRGLACRQTVRLFKGQAVVVSHR